MPSKTAGTQAGRRPVHSLSKTQQDKTTHIRQRGSFGKQKTAAFGTGAVTMQVVKTVDAIGMVIGHDLTEIVPGSFKGAAFRKGHVVRTEDIDHLLRMGKEHLYVMKLKPDEIHEEEAAIALGKMISGPGIYFTRPVEGKINLKAGRNGLLKINRDLQDEINELGGDLPGHGP
jgi:hypothetical protein